MSKSFNLANLSKEDMNKTNVDLAASGVAYKERMNQPVIADQVEREQPAHLREYFRERVAHYREVSKRLPTGSSAVYQQMAEAYGKK
ncbi:DNA polymerase III subunit theta [Serratia plymuthica]|uniref:DNA polymerase III subunit theta n=1 Tax=Serratia plymuthica TaxID=82996 RepID=UPI002DBB7D59|nr:DNA polymerase III subunit theta [Serratia plymuthica]MEB6537477.1 DNA polymerase III subunit theta [Serratia plymuthica]